MFPTSVALLVCALLLRTTDAACPTERPTKHLLCYVEEINSQFDPCLCTHLVLRTPLEKLNPESDLLKTAQSLQKKNPALKLIAVASDLAETALKRRDSYAKSVSSVVDKCGLDGVEIDLQWGAKVAGKVQLVDLVQSISKEFKTLEPSVRTKRSYKIYEQSDDDVTTPQWTPPNSKSKSRKSRSSDGKSKKETNVEQKKEGKEDPHKDIIVRLSSEPQHLAKNFDLKRLSKYVDLYTIASDNLTDASEHGVTYHPSRLMGIQDILNADSLVDLLTGLGAPHDKMILSLPATALKFTLKDSKKNLPQSPVVGAPIHITQSELCATMSEGNWTLERDEDLTAPYAFHDKTWIAFDDQISTSIKGKYILLRDLAGGAVMSADAEDWSGKCNSSKPAVLATLYNTFTNIARKSRAAQLISLQEELHESAQYSYSGDIHLSPYRIVRVVDRSGDIHVVRKEAKTEFECSRQGYFTHPSGCNRFYRCVKFNQYTPDFTVFEYDCPAGLAFDERYEVCVWPGSLPDGGACQGSSEIAPVPRGRYVCPRVEGYYADPENCRWFFACLDHVRDGATPLTAYEFRCPFGLVFNEKALVCDWPWLVEGCGGVGAYRATFSVGDFYEGRQRASYASLSDVHVSGGRIENVPGGLVLGSAVIGGYKGGLASGSNIHSSGAGLYSGGAYDYSGLSGGAYSAGSGAAHDGGLYVAGGHSGGNAGLYVADGNSGAYSGGAGRGSGFYATDGAYSAGGGSGYSAGSGGAHIVSGVSGVKTGYAAGGQYAGSSGAVNLGGAYGYGGGAAGYSAQGGQYHGASGGNAGYSGAGDHSSGAYLVSGLSDTSAYTTGSSSLAGGSYDSGKYSGSTGGLGYVDGSHSGGAYVAGKYSGSAGGLGYVDGSHSGGAYVAGKYSGSAGGLGYVDGSHSGGAYVAGKYSGSAGGLGYGDGSHSGGAYVAGKYSGSAGGLGYVDGSHSGGAYVAGGYAGGLASGVSTGSVEYSGDSGAYSGGHGGDYSGVTVEVDDGKYHGGQYSAGASKGAYSSSSFISQSGGNLGYDAGIAGGYDAGQISSTYHGGYGQKSIALKTPSVPVTLVSDAISSGYNSHDLSGFNVVSEHKPAVNFVNLESVRVTPGSDAVSGFGINHFVTPSPLPAVSVTPAISVSTYTAPVGVQTVTQSPVSISSYRTPVVYQSTPRPTTYYQHPALAVTPVPVTYQRPLVSTVSPIVSVTASPAPAVHYQQPTFIKTVTPAPAVSYSPVTSAPIFKVPTVLKTPVVPLNPVQYSTPSPISFGYSSPAPVQPIHISSPAPPVQPLQPFHFSTPAPAPAVSSVHFSYPKPSIGLAQTPVVPYNPVSYTFKQPTVSPIQYSTPAPAIIKTVTQAPVFYQEPIQPVQPVYQKAIPIQPVQPVEFNFPKLKPQAPSFAYTYNRPTEVPLAVTPAPIAVDYSPSPATIVKPFEVKYAYPRPTVLKTPVVPLNPIQYSTPSPINFQYSAPVNTYSYTQPEITVEPVAPVQPVSFVKSIPRPAFRAPIQYSTPAPIEYSPTQLPAFPIRPTVLKTPVVPLNPVQYTTSSPVFFEHSTPAPVSPVQYPVPFAPISSVKFGSGYKVPSVVQTVTQQPISIDYSYQQPAVIKTPVTPVSIEYSSIKQVPAIQQVEVNYNYPKPAVKFVQQPVVVSTTPATVYKTFTPTEIPMYQRVINAFKAPVVNAYQKVLNVISSTPAPLPIQPVTQSPISYAPVDVGYSYKRPALVKTQSIPVTPINVVPAYQKVLNVVKASTTPAPLYVNHYTSTYETPQFVSVSTPKPVTGKPAVIAESSYGLDFSNHGFEGNTDEFYEAVRQDFGSKLTSGSYQEEFSGYDYPKPVAKFSEGVSFVQDVKVPLQSDVKYYTSTEPVPIIKETYRKPVKTFVEYEQPSYNVEFESGKVSGYDQHQFVSTTPAPIVSGVHVGFEYDGSVGYSQLPVVSTTSAPIIAQKFTPRQPVKQFVQEFSGGHVGVEYDGSLGYSQLPVVSTTSAPIIAQKFTPRQPVKQFVQEYSGGHVGVEYDGSLGYSQLPVVSTTSAPVEITTARVSLPVVKSPRPVDSYYRRKQVRLRPVTVTTESYPVTSTYKSTVTPTIFTPSYYSTTPVPSYSSTASYEGDELEIEGENGDDSAKLLEAYNGQYGGVLTKDVSVSGYSGESSTVANIKDGEAIVGVLKKGRVDYTGRKTKSKVVVVSRLSDFNPILVGKLGAECSCSPKSNTVSLRRRGKQQLFTPKSYDFEANQYIADQQLADTYVTSTTTLSPESLVGFGESFYSEKTSNLPVVEIKPGRKTVFSTTVGPIVDAGYASSTEGVVVEPTLTYETNVVPKFRKTVQKTIYSEHSLRPTYQEVLLPNSIGTLTAAKSLDRFGPGGVRGLDETLQGSVDCKRAGLFRHPKFCNKFYACNWDQWKGRFTLHVFNCPVHLAYDHGLGACNWPSKGPACAEDNLLV